VSRTALVLAAHGSHHEARVNESIRAHADSLAAEGIFDEVLVAFHQGSPLYSEVLDQTSAKRVVVVPVMTSEGYYCDEVLPRELTATKPRSHGATKVVITMPVGTHPRLVDVVASRIAAWREEKKLPAEEVAVVVVGHGTRRNPRSRRATEILAEALRKSAVCDETLIAFLDEEPLIDGIAERISRPHVLVIPFLIGGGPHALYDIPRRMGVRAGGNVFVDTPIGEMPEIRSIIRDLAMSGLNALTTNSVDGRQMVISNLQSPIANSSPDGRGTALRLGTRGSALALWQARHVQRLLFERGVEAELVEISTSGDRRLDCAIGELNGDAPFCDDIDAALRSGAINLAVHALKDLPVPPPADLDIVAVLPRGDVSESLVSRHGETLAELSPGARVGTSSPRRAAQLLQLRPDLLPVTIRGAVDDRVRQVRRGDFDAAILATAGLNRLGLTSEIAENFSLDSMLPAPGQGALVIQIRKSDFRLRNLLAPLDHEPTRHAVTAELELLRLLQDKAGWTVAAWADVDVDGVIELQARLVSLDGSKSTDLHVRGYDPVELANTASKELLCKSTIDIRQSTMTV